MIASPLAFLGRVEGYLARPQSRAFGTLGPVDNQLKAKASWPDLTVIRCRAREHRTVLGGNDARNKLGPGEYDGGRGRAIRDYRGRQAAVIITRLAGGRVRGSAKSQESESE